MTWDIVLIGVTFLFLLFYTLFVLSARKGLLNLRLPQSSSYQPQVSVIIAARNEQATIARCLQSVLDQDYPSDRLEVILVDDGSEDESPAIAKEIAFRDKRLKVLRKQERNEDRTSRKPHALAMGIRASKGELVFTTDGDCVVPRTWVTTMVQSFDDGTAFVAGPVKEIPTTALISKLSQLEFLGIVGVSAGLIARKKPIICNGANVAFRRTAFDAANGYGDSGFCDDEVLMQRINQRGLGEVRHSGNKGSIVATPAPSSIRAFWSQRIRWAAKRGNYEDQYIFLKLVGLYLSFVSLFVFGVLSLFVSILLPIAVGFYATKAIVDYSMLRTAAVRYDLKVDLGDFFIAELLHVPYIVAAAFAGQFSSLEWKGKQIRA